MALTGINAVKKYASLFQEKRELEQRLKAMEPQMAELQTVVIDYFQRHGTDSWKGNGTTIYLRRELWAGHEGDPDAAAASLSNVGLGQYAKPRMNVQSLSAYVRELEDMDAHRLDDGRKPGDAFFDAHPDLRGVIKVSEVFKVGARKS